ncbi:taurine ABC transporter substrate-binding protein [Mastigocoleus testarum]|uniref:Taurine ABC transporter substrate-binding protein n=1 Tax=Mastigocoleus testarum BC008 TaxID=371196 RepID=A0A0V7ZZ37_9CYAN|nr:ABC transporter substrate-binding protein [Mastigocoleus testarum]KST67540.1 taurine ABC transporter substrate-binding protein [Mastigocoleus testarum BC008]KST69824.1 taurine ABC transporter substrate-binding protein [Mastigocoleus testarum BC008]
MRLKRRNVLFGLAGLGGTLLISSCGNSQSTPTDGTATSGAGMPSEIRIGYQVSANAELLAKAAGLAEKAFTDSKVKVRYISFNSGRDVNTAMASGGIDVGLIGSVGVAVGVAQKLPYQPYFIHSVIGEAEALVVKKNINSIGDIRGKKIAVPFGSTSHFTFLSLLKLEKIEEKELTILDLQPQDMVAAWQRGDIDGGYIWYPNLPKLVESDGKILITSADMAEKGVVTADLGVVRKEFADKYPDAMKKYVEVLDEAVNLYRKSPEEASKQISKEMGISPEKSLEAMNKLIWLTSDEQADAKYLGKPDNIGNFAGVLEESAQFMVTQKTISSAPDLKTYQSAIRNEFL